MTQGDAVRADHDVGRLDIAMHDAERMGVLQGVGDLCEQLGGFREGEAAAREMIGERDAFDKIADEIWRAVVEADFVNRDDRWKAKLGDAAGFAQEAIEVLRIGADVARSRNLDGDDAVEFGVVGFDDGAECTMSDGAEHLELANAFRRLVIPACQTADSSPGWPCPWNLTSSFPVATSQIRAVMSFTLPVETIRLPSGLATSESPFSSPSFLALVRTDSNWLLVAFFAQTLIKLCVVTSCTVVGMAS